MCLACPCRTLRRPIPLDRPITCLAVLSVPSIRNKHATTVLTKIARLIIITHTGRFMPR
jgi:hypothetical protein